MMIQAEPLSHPLHLFAVDALDQPSLQRIEPGGVLPCIPFGHRANLRPGELNLGFLWIVFPMEHPYHVMSSAERQWSISQPWQGFGLDTGRCRMRLH
jgi:hypothetical protein